MKNINSKRKLLSILTLSIVFLSVSKTNINAASTIQHEFYLKLPNGQGVDLLPGASVHNVYVDLLHKWNDEDKRLYIIYDDVCDYGEGTNAYSEEEMPTGNTSDDKYKPFQQMTNGYNICRTWGTCDSAGFSAPFLPVSYNAKENIYVANYQRISNVSSDGSVENRYFIDGLFNASYYHFALKKAEVADTSFTEKYKWFRYDENNYYTTGSPTAKWSGETTETYYTNHEGDENYLKFGVLGAADYPGEDSNRTFSINEYPSKAYSWKDDHVKSQLILNEEKYHDAHLGKIGGDGPDHERNIRASAFWNVWPKLFSAGFDKANPKVVPYLNTKIEGKDQVKLQDPEAGKYASVSWPANAVLFSSMGDNQIMGTVKWTLEETNPKAPTAECISKTSSSRQIKKGETATYTIEYTVGEIALDSLIIKDSITQGYFPGTVNNINGISSTPSNSNCSINEQGSVITCNPTGDLLTSGQKTITITTKPSQKAGIVTNTVTSMTGKLGTTTITGTGVGSNSRCSTKVTITENQPNAGCDSKEVNYGGTGVNFAIYLSNKTSIAPSAENPIVVTDLVPDLYTVVGAAAYLIPDNSGGTTYEQKDVEDGCASSSGQEIICKFPSMEDGWSGVVIIQTTVEDGLTTINNEATVKFEKDDGNTEDDVCSINSTIPPLQNPSIKCDSKKAERSDGTEITEENPYVSPGEIIKYTINYTNGPGPDKNLLQIIDTLPPKKLSILSYDGSSIPNFQGCSISEEVSRTVLSCWTSGVYPNTSGSLIINAQVSNEGIVPEQLIENSVTLYLYGEKSDMLDDNTCKHTIKISKEEEQPEVDCVKKLANNVTDLTVKPGDIVPYTLQYTVAHTPAVVHIKDVLPEETTLYTTDTDDIKCALPTETPSGDVIDCSASTGDTLSCTVNINSVNAQYNNVLSFCAKVDETGIDINGETLTNDQVKMWIDGDTEPDTNDDVCKVDVDVEHEAPVCIVTNPDPITIRLSDVANAIVMTTQGYVGTHTDLEFKWVMTYNGSTTTISDWHDSSGTPDANGYVIDTISMTPPSGLSEDDTFEIRAYVRPEGSSDDTGITSNADDDYDCDADVTITALDLICNWMVPNNSYTYFPFDMTFAADIAGNQGAAFTYDLDFGDGSTHYTGSGTVASGTTIELPYVPPQASPHTYDNTTSTSLNPRLTVTNTETGETSVCPTVLGGETQSEWTIIKDSDVDTCTAVNEEVTYTIVVTNTGDYTADLAQVRDSLDSKIDTSTIKNIKECDSNGSNCSTYSSADVVSGRVITWPGRTFTAGESRKYMYTVTISSAGDYYNIAEAIPESGETVRDDETFPTCTITTPTTPISQPSTGIATTAAYIAILGALTLAGGYYVYTTGAGAQIVANVLGKTGRGIRRAVKKKETFERNIIKASKDKLKD